MKPAKILACNGVYEPREDSYLLAEAVEKYARGSVLDLGTGTGIQGITAALIGCSVTFSDVQEIALECARKNAAANSVLEHSKFVKSDMFSSLHRKFDIIVFNPPYLPSGGDAEMEGPPDVSLDGGKDGRRLIDIFLRDFRGFLNPNGIALLLESSLNSYEKDVASEKVRIVGKAHYSFEDIVVLLIEK
ncbi:MAG: HemK2/MTQ2 family protein methyltransferase [Candidatus Micrarchaeia archaeon]